MLPLDHLRQVVEQWEADGSVTQLGTLIHIEGDTAWLAQRPSLRPARSDLEAGQGCKSSRFYWKRATAFSYAALLEGKESRSYPRITMTREELPALWHLSEEQLRGELSLPIELKYSPKRLCTWVTKRDQNLERIKPIVRGYDLSALLNDSELGERIKKHCEETRWHEYSCWSYVNRFIFAGATSRGLLPLSERIGCRGTQKIYSGAAGRIKKTCLLEESTDRAMSLSERDRENCREGWTRFMRTGVTVEKAFDQFSLRFYPASKIYIGPGNIRVSLLPWTERPTIDQFTYHGRGEDKNRTPWLIRLSQKSLKNDFAGHRGLADKGITQLLQVGIIDSTSDDQVLCSESSTLLMLQSTWTTRIIEGVSQYILGEYVGFERASARTHLHAIVNAAEDKVELVKQWGIDLKPGDWHRGTFASIRSDNGEGKSSEATDALDEAGIDQDFTPAYLARAKSTCELAHLLVHKFGDWRMPGSTLGKMRGRGEKVETDSYFDFTTFMKHRVQAVLYINNQMDATGLLTMAMRKAGVDATRRGIFEYMREIGQVASTPDLSLEALRPSILPQVQCLVRQSGIHVWDPREGGNARLIPGLIYWSERLHDIGLFTQASKRSISITLSIDSQAVGTAYYKNAGGIYEKVDLRTRDEEMCRISLVDWLCITDRDDVKRFLAEPARQDNRVSFQASVDDSASTAKAKRQKEKESTPNKTKSNKRANTSEELAFHNTRRLGVTDMQKSTDFQPPFETAQTLPGSQLPISLFDLEDEEDEGDNFMKNVRARRAEENK